MIAFVEYSGEHQLPSIIEMIDNALSEPYSIYTYRYFLHQWPELSFLAMDGDVCVGVIVCKVDSHKNVMRGYIAMLAVAKEYRKMGIGSSLVKMAVRRMKEKLADEVVLETEISNKGAQALYEQLGFMRDKRMSRYYLNGADAFRLKLWLS